MKYLLSHTAKFFHWKAQNDISPSCDTLFEQWVFVQIAGVLFEQKAGELLTLPIEEQFALPMVRRLACLERLAVEWGVMCLVLQQNEASSKVILYRPALVHARLCEVPLAILCGTLGYPWTPLPNAFVSEVGRRWREQGTIPHEIGFALGYPVKDVLGYMGLLPLECTGCCGWCIYGDPAPSFAMSRACQEARQCALCFLHQPAIACRETAAA